MWGTGVIPENERKKGKALDKILGTFPTTAVKASRSQPFLSHLRRRTVSSRQQPQRLSRPWRPLAVDTAILPASHLIFVGCVGNSDEHLLFVFR
jgi:hypothetical protein